MQSLPRFLALFSLLMIINACAHAEVGRKFDTAAASTIEVGKTTEAQVLSLLGEPLSRKINADGTKAYGYKYGKAQAFAFSRRSKRTWGQGDKFMVSFDNNGIVSSIEQSSVPMKSGPGMGD